MIQKDVRQSSVVLRWKLTTGSDERYQFIMQIPTFQCHRQILLMAAAGTYDCGLAFRHSELQRYRSQMRFSLKLDEKPAVTFRRRVREYEAA